MASPEVIDFIRVEKLNCPLFQMLEATLLSINAVLDDAEAKQIMNYNTKDVLSLRKGFGGKCLRKLPATSLVDESSVYGRDGDKEAITKLLNTDDSSGYGIGVVAIVGMGGFGKTTLAQIVYNDNKMEALFKFDMKIWVCFSENFDAFRVTKAILEGITCLSCDVGELNLLQVKLAECLMDKKFLLVLDDVWNKNYVHWEALKRPLTHGSRGTIGRRTMLVVVCECHGIPLAAKTVGGLLRSKRDVSEWRNVLEGNLGDLSKADDNIVPALLLSYHYLPSHLKRCFAYCATFPKDYDFEIENLVLLWMAEGLLSQIIRNKRPEDVGVEYFNNLRSRPFFQQSSGTRKLFVMHDLIHDLAEFVSQGFCMLGVHDSNEIRKTVQHFSYTRTSYDNLRMSDAFNETKCLRTFLPLKPFHWFETLPYEVYHDLLITLKCLRVLTLSRYDNIKGLPASIGDLQLLRYLDLSYTEITRLLESVCALYNLLTLLLADVSHSSSC
ncbi:putative disease resistance RPP13-like protein 1 [Hibiscus syriacus]|uniref:putative disease resistance RPP13-like protein 1 n=1 Tax=Hibiscus syriacus TaxID=106335 RepID=UPI001923E3E6|nr:putative disease resistance RPP13-like protein 1 [Hibiscus syriacus]